LAAVAAVRSQYFLEPYPVSTALVIAGLGNAEWLPEVEATAYLGTLTSAFIGRNIY